MSAAPNGCGFDAFCFTRIVTHCCRTLPVPRRYSLQVSHTNPEFSHARTTPFHTLPSHSASSSGSLPSAFNTCSSSGGSKQGGRVRRRIAVAARSCCLCTVSKGFCCCCCLCTPKHVLLLLMLPSNSTFQYPPQSISAVGRGSLTHLQQLPGCTVVQRVGCVACRPQQAGHQGVNVNICVAAAAAAQAATAGTAGTACTAAAQVVAVETDHSQIGVGERGLQSHSPQSTFGCLIHTTHNQASSLRPTHQHTPLLLC